MGLSVRLRNGRKSRPSSAKQTRASRHCFAYVILERMGDIDPLLYPTRIRRESEVKVSVDKVSFVDDEDGTIRILRAYVQLVVRGFDQDEKGAETEALFAIRGEYRVDYMEEKELTESELDAFTEINSVHNVWPFWRQHVYETVSRASLPRISIPFFRAIPGTPKAKRSTRRPPARKAP